MADVRKPRRKAGGDANSGGVVSVEVTTPAAGILERGLLVRMASAKSRVHARTATEFTLVTPRHVTSRRFGDATDGLSRLRLARQLPSSQLR